MKQRPMPRLGVELAGLELDDYLEEFEFNGEVDPHPLAVNPYPPACRGCGCTDDEACEGGCVWATADLCSNCVREGRS